MKTKANKEYECNVCKERSVNKYKILQCKARHLGITVETYEEYQVLRDKVNHLGQIVLDEPSNESYALFDEAVKKLNEFKKRNKINMIRR